MHDIDFSAAPIASQCPTMGTCGAVAAPPGAAPGTAQCMHAFVAMYI